MRESWAAGDATIRYAKSGSSHIAYATLGDGPIDVVITPAGVGNFWGDTRIDFFPRRFTSFARLVTHVPRGGGLSDPLPGAARVVDLAQPGEVLVSSMVKDLVVGSGIAFEDRGLHALKGVTDEWRLLSVVV